MDGRDTTLFGGALVDDTFNKVQPQGTTSVERMLGSGVGLYCFESGVFYESQRMLLLTCPIDNTFMCRR